MSTENLAFEVDWDMKEEDFRAQVNKMIKLAQDNHKVLVLPIEVSDSSMEELMLILASVNCIGCDSPCCKSNGNNKDTISIMPSDYDRLFKVYGKFSLVEDPDPRGWKAIKMPCRFLKEGRCSVYPVRPFVCAIYPFQPGGISAGKEAIALDSDCPEARRITKNVYIVHWTMRRYYQSLGKDDFVKALNNR